ncbi:hypothetical protein [Methanobacterium formicicum]|uniref:Uncharacterized protein n=1 Tax=Methanobacterium formicicum (strain DSM 3637 / PP1) TaxID=1204725 RepID=K2QAU2_METFP|nr:hypothetical protein [Methanobacterium formicicum]EKF85086.1 hypothetical protein A994_10724 [Methanobacterium formicicum DSM 3637]
MNLITSYNDLKFSIRCVDVWKKLKPSSDEIFEALNYHVNRSKNSDDISRLSSISLQEYLELLMDVIQEESGIWFFYVDIAGVLFDHVQDKKIFIYQTENGYCVIFEK